MELTAQQLRIGSALFAKKEGLIGYVSTINTHSFPEPEITLTIPDADNDNWDFELHELEPIPITEEILIRLGFKKGIAGYEKGDFDIRNYGEYWIEYGLQIQGFCPAIKYVHQLQNLFYALTGTELTLNN